MKSFRVLGPVQARADDRVLAVSSGQQLKLLAFLLLRANHTVSSDAVIDAMWGPERDGARKRLQMAIARLRKALAPLDGDDGSVLRTVGGGYLLSVGPGELDAEVFADRVQDGRRALEDGDPAGASERLSEALELWRGAPLAEVAFEDFAQGEIRRLEELRLAALETRIDADLQLGRHRDLLGELEALLDEQPIRERLAGQLMTALYRSGRQADALQVYQHIRTSLAEELGLEPGPALKALQAQILEQDRSLAPTLDGGALLPPRRRIAPLPSPATRLIGRDEEVDAVVKLLRSARLVTLIGPGGVGKTRLALAAAHALKGDFVDGACWVELAGAAQPEDVAPTIARALAVTPADGESSGEALRRSLASVRLLLVIDNFEHVLGAAGLLSELHASCASVTMLSTSRQPLDLAAEHRFRVEPLATPMLPSVAQIESSPASALFVAAARRRDFRYAVTPATAPLIAAICKRLDGLPLALELAAARGATLGTRELAGRLEESPGELGVGPRDAPVRQLTLDATIDWSYRLLDEREQDAFVRLAVFAGSTPASAEVVTGAKPATLEALSAKSLLDRCEQPDGTTRLVMLETVRQYGLERLRRDADRETVYRRHFDHYLQLVEQAARQFWSRHEQAGLDAIDRESDNIRAATRWALAAAPELALRLVGSLGDYWWIRNDPDALPWMDTALEAAGENASPVDRARVQLHRVMELTRHWDRGRHADAVDAANDALTLYRKAGDDAGIARALLAQARCAMASDGGDHEQERAFTREATTYSRRSGDAALAGKALARLANLLPAAEGDAILREAVGLLRRAGDTRELANVHNNAGFIALTEERIGDAITLLGVALEEATEVDNIYLLALTLGNLGWAHLFDRDPRQARACFAKELQLCVEYGVSLNATAEALEGLAIVATQENRLAAAPQLLGAARAIGDLAGNSELADRLEREFHAPARSQFGEHAWRQAERAGAQLPLESAIALALAQTMSPAQRHPNARMPQRRLPPLRSPATPQAPVGAKKEPSGAT